MRFFGKAFLVSFILIDIPVFAAVGILGAIYGFGHVFTVTMDYRIAHKWTILPSVLLFACLIIRRSRESHTSGGEPALTGSALGGEDESISPDASRVPTRPLRYAGKTRR